MTEQNTLETATQYYREVGAGVRPYERARCDDAGIRAIARDKVYAMLQYGIMCGRVTRVEPHHYVVSQAVYTGIIDLGVGPLLPFLGLTIEVRG